MTKLKRYMHMEKRGEKGGKTKLGDTMPSGWLSLDRVLIL
jgi:hypothetical protein